jgi:hypothetical protein
MKIEQALGIVRNPWGQPDDVIREARLKVCDAYEDMKQAYENMRDWAEHNGVDTKAYPCGKPASGRPSSATPVDRDAVLNASKRVVRWLDHANCCDLPFCEQYGSMRQDINALRDSLKSSASKGESIHSADKGEV